MKQPSNCIRHVSLFSEAWFEEESLETNRLNEGGISKEVLLDTLQVHSKFKVKKDINIGTRIQGPKPVGLEPRPERRKPGPENSKI